MSLERSILALKEIRPPEAVPFRDVVRTLFERAGLTLDKLMIRHGSLIQSDDETVALNAIKLGYQLHGMSDDIQSQQTNIGDIQVNIVQVTNNDSLSSTQG